MKRFLAVPSLFLASALAYSQLAPDGIAAELTLKDLENGKYQASRIGAGETGGMSNLFGMMASPIFMLMGAFSGGEGTKNSEMGLFTLLDLSWTKGEIIDYLGSKFLVTYKFDLDLEVLGQPDPPKPDEVRFGLNLVKTSAITQVAPRPKTTPAAIRKALEELANKPKSMPAIPVIPAPEPPAAAEAQSERIYESVSNQGASEVTLRDGFYDQHGVIASGKQNILSVMNGLRAYATKHKGQLPLTNNNAKLRRAFTDLGLEIGWSTQNPNGSEFVFNPHIRGRHISKLPSDMPFVWDSKANRGIRLVGFTGGRAELLTEDEFQKYCKKYKISAKRSLS
jgi:hypothetical protein